MRLASKIIALGVNPHVKPNQQEMFANMESIVQDHMKTKCTLKAIDIEDCHKVRVNFCDRYVIDNHDFNKLRDYVDIALTLGYQGTVYKKFIVDYRTDKFEDNVT